MTDVRLFPVSGIGEVRPGDDLAATLRAGLAASGIALEDGDVVAVTQKIVSKAEGRVVPEGPGGKAGWVLAASAIVCALMRPQILLATRVPDYERQDLIVMIDRSVSMRARDIRPSRFARATRELRNLVRQKPPYVGINNLGWAKLECRSEPNILAKTRRPLISWLRRGPILHSRHIPLLQRRA